jgi:hypothetical protein
MTPGSLKTVKFLITQPIMMTTRSYVQTLIVSAKDAIVKGRHSDNLTVAKMYQ